MCWNLSGFLHTRWMHSAKTFESKIQQNDVEYPSKSHCKPDVQTPESKRQKIRMSTNTISLAKACDKTGGSDLLNKNWKPIRFHQIRRNSHYWLISVPKMTHPKTQMSVKFFEKKVKLVNNWQNTIQTQTAAWQTCLDCTSKVYDDWKLIIFGNLILKQTHHRLVRVWITLQTRIAIFK